jgi:hypothetical protein
MNTILRHDEPAKAPTIGAKHSFVIKETPLPEKTGNHVFNLRWIARFKTDEIMALPNFSQGKLTLSVSI